MLAGKGAGGVGHHRTTAVLKGLNGDAPQSPALLGRRIETEQSEGQGQPGGGGVGRHHHHQVAAGLSANRGDRRQAVGQLWISPFGCPFRQGQGLPTEHQPAAGMGQQGAAQHQPVRFRQQLFGAI